MAHSSTLANLLKTNEQPKLSHNTNSQNFQLLNSSLHHYRQNRQEDDRVNYRNCVSETKGSKTGRRSKLLENEDSENTYPHDIFGIKGSAKVLKSKNILIKNGQNTKPGLPARRHGILTERQLNFPVDNKDSKEFTNSDTKEENLTYKGNSQNHNENNSEVTSKSQSVPFATNPKKLQNYSVKQLLHISKSRLNFGKKMPGQIIEESLDVVNKSNQNLVVQIILGCDNPEFQDTEEYVYSIHRSHLYDFNERHVLIMAPYSSAGFKVTLKVPNVKKECKNNGYANISIQGIKESFKVILESTIKIPRVICPKTLYHRELNYNMIKLAVKEGKKQDFKLPFRNIGDMPVTLEFNFHNSDKINKEDEIDCMVSPQMVTLHPNGTIFLNISTNAKQRWWTSRQDEEKEDRRNLAKVLIAKVKDTNLIYSYFFLIEKY